MPGASITSSIQPTQRAGIFYSSSATIPTGFRNKHSLVIIGRTPTNPGAIEAANAGAIVAIYIDVTVYTNVGVYHNLFFNSSTINGVSYGSIGSHSRGGTSYGPPVNFNSSIAADKYEALLRKVKADNPWCNAIFCDDQGPDWSGYNTTSFYQSTYNGQPVMTTADKTAAKAYQIALALRARKVADELGLLLICNAEWRADNGNGYPASNTHGCNQYDSFCIEHHAPGEAPYWDAVSAGQWRLRDTSGNRAMFFIADNTAQRDFYRNRTHIAWLTTQQGNAGYNSTTADTSFTPHDLGLNFGSAPTVTVNVSPTTATVQVGTTRQFTATVSNGAAVTWRAGGIVGGNSTFGTISGTGLYTAPVSVPTSGFVSISATTATGESGSATVEVSGVVVDPPPTEAPLPPNPTVQEFGNRFVGANQSNLTNDINRTVTVVAPQAGTIQKLVGLVDGLAVDATGQQPLRFTLYRDDGNGNPGTLAASSSTFNVVANSSPTWAALSLSTTVAANEVVHIGIHSGSTVAAGRYYWTTSSGVQRYVNDVFADGSVTPFGTGVVGNADISIWADYTPAGTVGATVSSASFGSSTTFGSLTSATVVSQPQALVVYLREPQIVVKQVPVPYAVLEDGSVGGRVVWNPSTQQFEPLN